MSAFKVLAQGFTTLVAIEHFLIYLMETWLWRTKARPVFGVKRDQLNPTSPLAAQLGCYNFFLGFGCLMGTLGDDFVLAIASLTFVIWAAGEFETMQRRGRAFRAQSRVRRGKAKRELQHSRRYHRNLTHRQTRAPSPSLSFSFAPPLPPQLVFGSTSFKSTILLTQGAPAIIAWILMACENGSIASAGPLQTWAIMCWSGFVIFGVQGWFWKVRENKVLAEEEETKVINTAEKSGK
jgi:uncharacterized membrane protein